MIDKTTFNFKKFKIKHDKCAMKIGTDGVLLGAWVDVVGRNVLDVGTGTGLLAIMLAQRFPVVFINGLELDESAAVQAQDNAVNSIFKNQLSINQGDFNDYQASELYDLVVSNPPYFIDSLKSSEKTRTQARHTDTLAPNILFQNSYDVLTKEGELAIVFPSDSDELILKIAEEVGFYVKRKTSVYATVLSEQPKRTLWQFSKVKCVSEVNTLVIEKERHVYTEEYIALTREFYLKM